MAAQLHPRQRLQPRIDGPRSLRQRQILRRLKKGRSSHRPIRHAFGRRIHGTFRAEIVSIRRAGSLNGFTIS